MFKPQKIECIQPGRGSRTRFNIGKGSPRHAEYKIDVSKQNVHALIESGDHDHISKTVAYYHTSKHGPQTSLIQYGKADDEKDASLQKKLPKHKNFQKRELIKLIKQVHL